MTRRDCATGKLPHLEEGRTELVDDLPANLTLHRYGTGYRRRTIVSGVFGKIPTEKERTTGIQVDRGGSLSAFTAPFGLL